MEQHVPTLSCSPPRPRPVLSADKLLDILIDTAIDSVVLTFLVSLAGSITMGVLSGVLRDMVPSLPPGFAHPVAPERPSSPAFDSLSHWFQQHHFAILFWLIFACKIAARLIHYSPREEHRTIAARAARLYRRLSNQWFGLLIVNAFTAFGLAMALYFAQQFSAAQFIWHALMSVIGSLLTPLLNLLPGKGIFEFFENLVAWYGDNQFKFSFWLFYSAAICDDLGLPNYKALLRWGWRRFKKGAIPKPPTPATT